MEKEEIDEKLVVKSEEMAKSKSSRLLEQELKSDKNADWYKNILKQELDLRKKK